MEKTHTISKTTEQALELVERLEALFDEAVELDEKLCLLSANEMQTTFEAFRIDLMSLVAESISINLAERRKDI